MLRGVVTRIPRMLGTGISTDRAPEYRGPVRPQPYQQQVIEHDDFLTKRFIPLATDTTNNLPSKRPNLCKRRSGNQVSSIQIHKPSVARSNSPIRGKASCKIVSSSMVNRSSIKILCRGTVTSVGVHQILIRASKELIFLTAAGGRPRRTVGTAGWASSERIAAGAKPAANSKEEPLRGDIRLRPGHHEPLSRELRRRIAF